MLKATKKSHNLEILISTMNRASLSFLNNMFPSINDSNINMLVVNQTNESSILVSNSNHIKVLNKKNLECARGLSSFSSDEIMRIMGCHSKEIQKILGYISKSEVIHKDDMVEI